MEHSNIIHPDSRRSNSAILFRPRGALSRIAPGAVGVLFVLVATCAFGADPPPHIEQSFRSGTGGRVNVPLETEVRNGKTILRAAGLTSECYLCTPPMLMASAREFGVTVGTHLESSTAARVQFRGFANDRAMWIDDIAVPGHLLELRVVPGTHMVTVHQNGATGTLKLRTAAGATPFLSPTDFKFPHLKPRLRNAGMLLATLGAITGATGGILLYYNGGCETGNCSNTHETLVPGIVFSSLGAAMVGMGIALLVKRHRLKKEAMHQFTGGKTE